MSPSGLTHLDEEGHARMVDVGAKEATERFARARAHVRMSPRAAAIVQAGGGPKGEVLAVARLAGIQAAKQTAQLIPLAHPLPLSFVDVTASVIVDQGLVELLAEARTRAPTGVEMEAMTACSVAALTVYDMVKALETGIAIEGVVLLEKRGGRTDYRREDAPSGPRGASVAPGGRTQVPGAAPSGAPRTAILTISTSKARGQGVDESGPRLRELAEQLGVEVIAAEVIGDDRHAIEGRLRHYALEERCALVLTSGGTGVAPSDVTPEATLAVIQREIPGIAEAMRAASREHTPFWPLSRALAGVCGGTLIVNLPGSPRSIEQTAAALGAILPHALELIAGGHPSHRPGAAAPDQRSDAG